MQKLVASLSDLAYQTDYSLSKFLKDQTVGEVKVFSCNTLQ